MYRDINERLATSKQEVYRLEKLNSMIEFLERDLEDLEEQLDKAKATLEKEQLDYEKISSSNMSTFFYSIMGKLEEKTEKERLEAVEAQLKYNQCEEDIESARKLIGDLQEEKSRYRKSETDFRNLYEEKQRMLIEAGHVIADEILDLEMEVVDSKSNAKEIKEAYDVGRLVLKKLDMGIKSLYSASDWGMWDLLGGGLISDLAKHSHLDEVNRTSKDIQGLLRKFRTELADIHISGELDLDISSFAKFADFFFDGLIADWFVQNKINTTKAKFENMRKEVGFVVNKLDEMMFFEEQRQRDIKDKMTKLILEV